MRKGRSLNGEAMQIRNIILHSSDGRKAGDLATLSGEKVSAHWYVTRAGEIFHLVDDEDTAFHAGDVTKPRFFSNAATIGIEQEHFDPDPKAGRPHNEDWPERQIETVAELVAFLLQEHGLNSPDDIKTHAEVAAPPGRKQDPFGYPFDHFFSLVADNRQFTWNAKEVPVDAPAKMVAARESRVPNRVRPGKRRLASDPELVDVAADRRILAKRPGRQAGVGAVQDALIELGARIDLGSGGVNRGIFGPQTEAAVEDFQGGAGIRVDGQVGQDTIGALDRALAEKGKPRLGRMRAGEKPAAGEPMPAGQFVKTLAKVFNRGIPPLGFLQELVAWGKMAPDEIFADQPGNEKDVYASVITELGPFGDITHRKACMLEVMRVLAGFESSWNFNEGRDTTNKTSVTPDTIEAGAWQVSANSMNFGDQLKVFVRANVGTLDGNAFQKAMKQNHPLAMEYIARLMRRTRMANGPLKKGDERRTFNDPKFREEEQSIYPWLSREAVEEFEAFLRPRRPIRPRIKKTSRRTKRSGRSPGALAKRPRGSRT